MSNPAHPQLQSYTIEPPRIKSRWQLLRERAQKLFSRSEDCDLCPWCSRWVLLDEQSCPGCGKPLELRAR